MSVLSSEKSQIEIEKEESTKSLALLEARIQEKEHLGDDIDMEVDAIFLFFPQSKFNH